MIAFDTNIFIYACDQSEPRRQQTALDLLDSATEGVMLWQAACEFIAACRKLSDQGFTPGKAWERLAEFIRVFPLLVPSAAALDRARTLHVDSRLSFWDALLVAAPRDHQSIRLASRI